MVEDWQCVPICPMAVAPRNCSAASKEPYLSLCADLDQKRHWGHPNKPQVNALMSIFFVFVPLLTHVPKDALIHIYVYLD